MQQRITPIVLNLIIINVLVFFVYHMRPDQTRPWLILQKPNVFGLYHEYVDEYGEKFYYTERNGKITGATKETDFKPVQLVSHFFSHFEIWHIVMNMLALVFLGTMCEMTMGPRRFIEYYLFAGLFGGILVALFDPSPAPILGASGAISGLSVLVAYYYPRMPMQMMFIPIEFTARSFAIGFAIFSAAMILLEISGNKVGPNISHFGHLAGMVAGYLYFNRFKLFNLFKPK